MIQSLRLTFVNNTPIQPLPKAPSWRSIKACIFLICMSTLPISASPQPPHLPPPFTFSLWHVLLLTWNVPAVTPAVHFTSIHRDVSYIRLPVPWPLSGLYIHACRKGPYCKARGTISPGLCSIGTCRQLKRAASGR